MFKELNENLSSIEGEVSKLKTAVSHIEQSKEAALKAVNAAESTNREFKEHLLRVTADVDSILKPHKDLIYATEKLTNSIETIGLVKQLKTIKLLIILTGIIALMAVIAPFWRVLLTFLK
jgi:chromosome segregation ATPase